MFGVVARTHTGLVLMHMLGEPRTMQEEPRYDDVAVEVASFLEERLAFAVAHGIPDQRDRRRVLFVGAVRKVDAGYVESRVDEAAERLARRARGTQRADDLRSAVAQERRGEISRGVGDASTTLDQLLAAIVNLLRHDDFDNHVEVAALDRAAHHEVVVPPRMVGAAAGGRLEGHR